MAWTQAVSDLIPGEVVAIDGKTVRRSHDRNSGQRAIHLVSAWASANTLTLGQVSNAPPSPSCCKCWNCRGASSLSTP